MPEFDLAAGAENAMPWEEIRWVCSQQTGDGPMVERISRCGSDLAVGTDLSGGNREDDSTEGFVPLGVGLCAIAQDSALELGAG